MARKKVRGYPNYSYDSKGNIYNDKRGTRVKPVKKGSNSETMRVRLFKDGVGKNVPVGRIVAGTPKGSTVEHKNGNAKDNRKKNLKNVSRAQNTKLAAKRGAYKKNGGSPKRGKK